jgi:hypothetical protein
VFGSTHKLPGANPLGPIGSPVSLKVFPAPPPFITTWRLIVAAEELSFSDNDISPLLV